MNLHKNGFVVARLGDKKSSYVSWPLSDLADDKLAKSLTDQAYENWFAKYDMQQIAPDLEYIKSYLNYCNMINLKVEVLLFESLDDSMLIDDELEVCEVLGFDCIGTVYYSYLQTEYNEFEFELKNKNVVPNQYGLLDNIEDVLYFIELRQKAIADGTNLEDFFKELPVKISIVNIVPTH